MTLHKHRQKMAEIKTGTRVKVKFWRDLAIVRENRVEDIVVELRTGETNSVIKTATEKQYEYSLILSPDCENAVQEWPPMPSNSQQLRDMMRDVWTRCEQHYGIRPCGSQDPEVFRQIAIDALRGDFVALDVINDGLKEGTYNRRSL